MLPEIIPSIPEILKDSKAYNRIINLKRLLEFLLKSISPKALESADFKQLRLRHAEKFRRPKDLRASTVIRNETEHVPLDSSHQPTLEVIVSHERFLIDAINDILPYCDS